MRYFFREMNDHYAQQIAGWHYETPYTFYDMGQDVEDLEAFLNPANWPHAYYAVVDEQEELVGYFTFHLHDRILDLGLGLRPEFTGKGWGLEFVQAGLAFGRQQFKSERFRLMVAAFNERAIKVYRRAGFEVEEVFMNATNGGEYEFVRMSCKV